MYKLEDNRTPLSNLQLPSKICSTSAKLSMYELKSREDCGLVIKVFMWALIVVLRQRGERTSKSGDLSPWDLYNLISPRECLGLYKFSGSR